MTDTDLVKGVVFAIGLMIVFLIIQILSYPAP